MRCDRWKVVDGFEGYRICTDGTLLSFKTKRPHVMKGLLSHGYRHVSMRKNGKGYSLSLHRLMLENFVGPCPKGMETRHLNGNPLDNRLSNLEWGTYKENARDQYRHGTRVRGERAGRSKLNEDEVRTIKGWLLEGVSTYEVAKRIKKVSYQSIQAIKAGRTWSQVEV